LTALAEGADRLAAEVAIELDLNIVVPLPMPLREYEKDFGSNSSKSQFRDLLSKSIAHFVVHDPKQVTGSDQFRRRAAREIAYARAGAYVARHCLLLIALWDGVPTNSGSGTSQIINLRLRGSTTSSPMFRPTFHNLEGGPVAHIVTPRMSNPSPKGVQFSTATYFPEYWGGMDRAKGIYETILKHLEKYNHDAIHYGRLFSEEIKVSMRSTLNDHGRLSEANLSNLFRFACADVLATKFKAKRVGYVVALFAIVLLGFFYFQIYLELSSSPAFLLMYPIVLGVAALIYMGVKRKDYESKHEDYRALAEALRVQLFWDLAGVNESVSNHYLYKHTGQLQWIRYALGAWRIGRNVEGRDSSLFRGKPRNDIFKNVFERWVLRQSNWYHRRSAENDRQAKALERIGNTLFVGGMGLALILFGFEGLSFTSTMLVHEVWIHHFVVITIAMALAVSASLHGYSDRLSLSEESKQYQGMADLFSLAELRLTPLVRYGDADLIRRLMFELGKEALVEHGDWLLLNRSRPLELPKA
jgi:hypothetical protein